MRNNNKTILLVEDNFTHFKIISTYLMSLNYEVFVYSPLMTHIFNYYKYLGENDKHSDFLDAKSYLFDLDYPNIDGFIIDYILDNDNIDKGTGIAFYNNFIASIKNKPILFLTGAIDPIALNNLAIKCYEINKQVKEPIAFLGFKDPMGSPFKIETIKPLIDKLFPPPPSCSTL